MLSSAATASIELATVAYAGGHGGRSLAGLILAGSAVGSCAGGLWYGARKWRSPNHHRFAAALVVSALATGLLPLAPDLPVLAVLVAVVGVFIAPTLIGGYTILEVQARPGRETEALSWVGFSNCVGAGAGSALTGIAVDSWGTGGGYLAATGCAALAAIVCLATLSSLGPSRPAGKQAKESPAPDLVGQPDPVNAAVQLTAGHRPLTRGTPTRTSGYGE
jgi:MFS family permease